MSSMIRRTAVFLFFTCTECVWSINPELIAGKKYVRTNKQIQQGFREQSQYKKLGVFSFSYASSIICERKTKKEVHL